MLLLSGTALAQLIPLLASVLLARLYTPDDYGAYGWALSVVILTTLIASGAYGQAVNVPQETRQAVNLAALVMLGGLIVGVAVGLAGLAEAVVAHRFAHRMWFIPAATFLLSVQNASAALASREARFGAIVRARMALAAAGATVSLTAGWLCAGEAGLMMGNLAGVLAACLVFAVDRRGAGFAKTPPGRTELWGTARRFAKFPRWQLPSALIDATATQSPVWIISSFFGLDVLGQFSFAIRVLGAPLQLLGASFGETFRQQCSAEWRQSGQGRQSFATYSITLGTILLPALLLLGFLGPSLVTAVFGDRWALAGEMVRFLAVLYVLRGSIGTLSYVLILADRQRAVFIIHLLFLACSAITLLAAAAGLTPVNTVLLLVTANAVVYAVYAGLIARASAAAPPVS